MSNIQKPHNYIDGRRKKPEYDIWRQMIRRCTDKRCKEFQYYGKRGINVCEKWLKFEGFIADMGFRPDISLSLERLDNLKNYEKSNCKWATSKEQSRNKRSNIWLTYKGETKLMSDWALILKVHPRTIHLRLNKLKWSVERALSTFGRNTGRP